MQLKFACASCAIYIFTIHTANNYVFEMMTRLEIAWAEQINKSITMALGGQEKNERTSRRSNFFVIRVTGNSFCISLLRFHCSIDSLPTKTLLKTCKHIVTWLQFCSRKFFAAGDLRRIHVWHTLIITRFMKMSDLLLARGRLKFLAWPAADDSL